MSTSNTVILGAGIVGLSTAYYLSDPETSRTQARNIHIVESSPELFYCASGLAGGFIAADWFSPSAASLGLLSFNLHQKLAKEHNGREKWGYSPSTGLSLSLEDDVVGGSGEDWLRNGTSRAQAAGGPVSQASSDPVWLTRTDGASLEVISRDDSTAQIDPLRLCKWLLEQSVARGVHLHQPAKAMSLLKDIKGDLASIRIAAADGTETDLPCTRLVICTGSWAPRTFKELFPKATVKIPVSPLAGHSILLRSPRWTKDLEANGCHAVFATDTLGFSPELFSRLDGEIYIAGLNSTMIPMPDLATDVQAQDQAVEQMKGVAARMLGIPDGEDDLELLRASLCFRGLTSSGRPIVSRIPDRKLGDISTRGGVEGGVYVATGHGAWGISQSLGTGKVMTEMMDGLPTSANIKALVLPS